MINVKTIIKMSLKFFIQHAPLAKIVFLCYMKMECFNKIILRLIQNFLPQIGS